MSFKEKEPSERSSLLARSQSTANPRSLFSNTYCILVVIFIPVFSLTLLYALLKDRGGLANTIIKSGDRIHLRDNEGYYFRVDHVTKSRLVGTETIPWLSGSTFRVVKENNCWFLQSVFTGLWMTSSLYDNLVVVDGISLQNAICFVIIDVQLQPTLKLADTSHSLTTQSKLISPKSLQISTDVSVSTSIFISKVDFFRGVNLGGWFIPEVWMTPKFFTGSELGWGGSLCGMCQWNASETSTRMRSHLKSWITERDFSEIKSQGFNSVRLPIGYWNLISDPYHLYAPSDVTESLEVIDWCFEMATKYNLLVLLDLHGAPGSQNGIDHSGCAMSPNWTHPLNINLSLEAVGVMARRYGKHPQLLGLELMNEPGWPIENKSHSVLLKYYYDSYHIIRESSSTALVVFNELYESYYSAWGGELLEPDYYNVVVDWHLYDWQEPYTKRNITQHIDDAHRWRPLIRDHSLFPFHPIIVGEWCMSTGTFVQAGQPFVDASLDSFAESLGWFLWNWKVEKGINFDEWDVQLQLSLPEGLRISLPR